MNPIKLSRRIGFRLTVVNVTTLLISCLTIGLVVYSSLIDVVKRNEADSMSRRMTDYKFAYRNGGVTEFVRLVEFHKDQNPKEKFSLLLENASGEIYKSEGMTSNFKYRPENISTGLNVELSEAEQDQHNVFQRFDFSIKKFILNQGWFGLLKFFNFEVVYIYKENVDPNIQMTIFQSFNSSEKDFARVRELALLLVLIFIGIGLIIGITLSKRVIVPIQKIIHTIDKLESGSTSERIGISGEEDELDLLAREFNKLMDSKDALLLNINNTLDTVAHEIRTPLTRFRIGAELAIIDKSQESNYKTVLKDGLEASEQISYLLTNILEASRTKNGSIQLEQSHFLLNDLFSELKEIYSFLLEEKNICLEVGDEKVSVFADKRLILQAVNNLVDNAIKYTPSGGRISLFAVNTMNSTEITVSDNGIGIPDNEHYKIWERLYRSGNHTSEKGYGIGLSVVKSIVELHDGVVSVESKVGEGSKFKINLKIQPFDRTL